ncbi:adenylosuccinate lyase [bacterium]|nr:adenylosuccinate lyase [bacterium]
MTHASWNAISPLDGRYAGKLTVLAPLVSESGLIQTRLRVEAAWLLHLLKTPGLVARPVDPGAAWHSYLGNLASGAGTTHGQGAPATAGAVARIKELESVTNHDVKAAELYLQEELARLEAPREVIALVHFGCTSEDINNVSYALMMSRVRDEALLPALTGLVDRLARMSRDHASVAMLARTHGQPATPTTFGKEMAVFGARLAGILDDIENTSIMAKFNGATGGYSAHAFALPDVDWARAGTEFIASFDGLQPNPLTTQIEPHDWIARVSATSAHLCGVATGLARDFWQYIADGWCVLKRIETETGSSTMPHKINPIDFENAEGNFAVAQSMFEHFARKLTVSRLQRDLTDSTTMRNLGVAFGHLILGLKSIQAGLDRLQLNEGAMAHALDQHWEVLGEAVQSLLRVRGVEGAYARMKSATRGLRMTREDYLRLVDELMAMRDVTPALSASDVKRLRELTPATYTGLSAQLAGIFWAAWSRRKPGGNA